MRRRPLLIGMAALLVIATIAGVSLLAGGLTVRISEAMIRGELAKRFPLTRTHLLILTVRYHDPVVALDGGDDRVRIGISATPEITLGGKAWTGTILVDAGIRYEPETGACFLTGFKVLKAQVDGLPQAKQLDVANRCVAMFEDEFAKTPVYTLDDADFRQRTAKMLVKGVHIQGRAIVVQLGL